MVSPSFHAGDVRGRHQIKGNAGGPTLHSARTINVVRKYHGSFFPALQRIAKPSRNSLQCLLYIASS